MARRTKRITTKPGYVKYLRTSDEDAQAPERSQNGQRRDIERLLAAYPSLPDLGEYIDNYTGTSADHTPTQNEQTAPSLASDFMEYMELTRYPQRLTLEQLLIDEQ